MLKAMFNDLSGFHSKNETLVEFNTLNSNCTRRNGEKLFSCGMCENKRKKKKTSTGSLGNS